MNYRKRALFDHGRLSRVCTNLYQKQQKRAVPAFRINACAVCFAPDFAGRFLQGSQDGVGEPVARAVRDIGSFMKAPSCFGCSRIQH